MSTHSALNLESFPNSPYARELRQKLTRLRFTPEVESGFKAAHLRHARGRIRAWHTTVLAVLLFAVVPSLLTASSADPGVFAGAWNRINSELLLALVIMGTLSRTALAVVAWSPWFERIYPRIAFPLVVICHGSWALMCSGEILTSHPEYLAPLVADTFAAYFFSGLLFRQAIVVNLIAALSMVLGGWYYSGAPAPILFYSFHLLTNIVMSAIAGFAYERSSRSLFLEHSLLSEMAALDGLTGLKNRRAFDEHLTRVWQQGLRDRRPLGLLMIDVDEFKHYNDCYGHQAGDRALRRIAEVTRDLTRRPLDLAARYGGEELAVILYAPSRDHVVKIAEQLLRSVQTLGIEHRNSTAGVVTVSVGVAIIAPELHRSPQGALQLADEALYAAKREGRNRINVLENEYDSLSTGVFHTVAQGR